MAPVLPLLLAASLIGHAPAQSPTLTDSLLAIERAAWEAWKTRQPDFYRRTLIPESLYLSGLGAASRDETAALVTRIPCTVQGYELDQPRSLRLTEDSAILIAHTIARYTCNGKEIEAADWISTVFVRREGEWRIAFHQETKAAK